MLNENSYTTQELIHYAGVDDRFKPLLADRIAREGHLPDDDETADLEERVEELEERCLTTRQQTQWMNQLQRIRNDLLFACETGATSAMHQAIDRLDKLHTSISMHDAD